MKDPYVYEDTNVLIDISLLLKGVMNVIIRTKN